MLFTSLSYPLFLWTVYVLWWTWVSRRSMRHAMVLVASYWFYGQAHWGYVSLLAVSTVVDYVAGNQIHAAHGSGAQGRAKAWLTVSLVVNLGLLGVFKYFDFFSASVQESLAAFGVEVSTWRLELILPVGISFYTFQTLSYSLDIYRKRLEPVKHLLDFAVYVAFFPQLVAGPIVRARDFLPQMDAPLPPTRERLGGGLLLILQGLVKKLLIGDVLGSQMVDPIFGDAGRLAALDAGDVFVLGLGFLIQVYGDFAGYTDVAIGSARLLGFNLRKNFNQPLRASSIFDFWDRWHISMSTWFRDYVCAPHVGRQAPLSRACLATLVTLVIVGIWHGAAWTFVLFGLIHGVVMSGARVFRALVPMKPWRRSAAWRTASWAASIGFVCLTVLLYRADTVDQWIVALGGLGNWSLDGLAMPWQVWVALAVGVGSQLVPPTLWAAVERRWMASPAPLQGAFLAVAAVLLFGLRPPGVLPFIYFQF